MATRSASLPIERTYLSRAWLAVTGILLVGVVIVTIAVAIGRSTPRAAPGWAPSPTTGPSRCRTSRSS